ncbi:MAG: ATP-binding protein [Candidatus Bipolaricaulia bacterium]
MRIARVRTGPLGPLPALDWALEDCEVVYDDNQQGKTTLIDVLIHYLFKEGTKRLFEGEDRYAAYPDTAITVERRGETYTFGSERPSARLSELLGWNMPELHRLLCVRAGEMAIHGGGRKREEMWQLLSGLLSGLEGNRVERVKKRIQNQASVTSTFQWSNQGHQKVRERYVQRLVPQLERARDAEETVRRLMALNQEEQETASVQSELEAKRQALQERRHGLETLKRRHALEQARDLLDRALTLRRKIADEFGERITVQLGDEWSSLAEELADARERLEQSESLSAELQRIDDALQQREAQIDEAREERERQRAQWRDWRENRLRPLAQRVENRQAAFQSARKSAPLGIGMGVVGVGLALAGLLGEGLSPWVGIGPGALLLGSGAGLVARVPQTRKGYELAREQLAGLLSDQLHASVSAAQALDRAHEVLTADILALVYPDGEDPVDQLQASVHRLETERAMKREQLLEVLPADASDQDPTQFCQRCVDDLEKREDDLRRKTGCPDLETFQTQLEARRRAESELSRLRTRLSQALDVPEEDLDLDAVATQIEQRWAMLEVPAELGEVDDPDAELAKVRQSDDEVRQQLDQLERRLDEIKQERHGIRQAFAELGIAVDAPEKLFETRRRWKAELAEGVRDRLAATLACSVLDQVQRDYQTQIKRLLEGGDLNRLYREAMGQGQEVRFNGDSLTFEVERDGQVIGERALSTGALTHLYFVCRLSVLRRLFDEAPGFLILDDPFLTYAPARKQRAIGLLEPFLADGWQVIAFTVDPATRDGLQDLGGTVRRIQDL